MNKLLIEYDSNMGGASSVMWIVGLVGVIILMSAGWYFIKKNMKS